jgi:hypothetical protein
VECRRPQLRWCTVLPAPAADGRFHGSSHPPPHTACAPPPQPPTTTRPRLLASPTSLHRAMVAAFPLTSSSPTPSAANGDRDGVGCSAVPLDALLLAHARATQEDLPQPRRQILFHTPDGASTSLGSPLLLVPRSRATTKLGFRSRSGRHSSSAATTPCASSAGEAHSPSAATTPRASRSAVAKIFAGLRPRGGYKLRILRGRGTLSLRRHHTSRIQERHRQDLRWPLAAWWLQAAQASLRHGEVPKALCNKVAVRCPRRFATRSTGSWSPMAPPIARYAAAAAPLASRRQISSLFAFTNP